MAVYLRLVLLVRQRLERIEGTEGDGDYVREGQRLAEIVRFVPNKFAKIALIRANQRIRHLIHGVSFPNAVSADQDVNVRRKR